MDEFRSQLEKGIIPRAYDSLLSYMRELRIYFKSDLDLPVSGLYQGYMDMTYFAVFPPELKERKLKVAVVFNYERFTFEAWLAGKNRQINREIWKLFRNANLPDCRIVAPAKGIDSIVERDLASEFDLGENEALTAKITSRTTEFIDDIKAFLARKEGVSDQ
jgi:hypothetical protein